MGIAKIFFFFFFFFLGGGGGGGGSPSHGREIFENSGMKTAFSCTMDSFGT